jgi:CelD/BcsL family acetyltransferase involved in cellulose biosynthesis
LNAGESPTLPRLSLEASFGVISNVRDSSFVVETLTTERSLPNRSRPLNHASRTRSLRFELISGRELDESTTRCWRELQAINPDLRSPCFAPEFAQCVSAARTNVELCLARQNRELVAIFPFQRQWGSRGTPVGGIVSDYQGLICGPDFECDPTRLLRACGLATWDFDRLIASQSFFVPFHKLCEPSALIDLSNGFAGYASELRAHGSKQLRQARNLMRRLDREVGRLRFICHSSDRGALTRVLHWKSQQYKRSGWRDLFAVKWGRELVERVHAMQSEDFAGMLSLLFAGDRLIAGHMGMRSSSVWHYWFPAYNPEFSKYSPGIILLLKMIEQGPGLGLRTIDLGTGKNLYKERLSNTSIQVAEGSVERPSLRWVARQARRGLKRLIAHR